MVAVRLLGSVEVAGARPGSPREACVLAVLALSPGEPVPVGLLIERLWGGDPPDAAVGVVYGCISRLRGRFRGRLSIPRGTGGYRLDVPAGEIDVFAARALVRLAEAEAAEGRGEEAVRIWRQADGLWRGEPLTKVKGAWAQRTREALTDEHLSVLSGRYEAELAVGRHRQVVGELSAHVADHPHAEPLVATLMVALYRDGRAADALACFDRARARLRDDLGQDPGERLRDLQRRILNDDGELRAADAAEPARHVPKTLPADVPGFTGREAALTTLDDLLTEAVHPGPIALAAITGVGGVGKTALAVHWAHRNTAVFPDGQLYANLGGYSPLGPVEPAAALETLLWSLGVARENIPSTVDARSAMLRTRLAGRRMLLVLDNARDAEHVRPLLPGSDATVLVTSRNRLRGLRIRESAHVLALDEFSPAESAAMLAGTAGPAAIEADPVAWQEIAALCGHLPLALAVVAAGDVPAARALAHLRDGRARLDAMSDEDPASDPRAVFDWSYRALEPDEARAFRLLTMHPGTDLPLEAATALLAADARRLTTRLTAANLLREPAPGRFEYHDLLRVYAEETSRAVDGERERSLARQRLADWHLGTLDAVRSMVRPHAGSLRMDTVDGVVPLTFETADAALAWCDRERANIVAVVTCAERAGLDEHAWRMAHLTWFYFNLRSAWDDWIGTCRAGLASARRLGDREAEGRMLGNLGIACSDSRRLTEALTWFARSEEVFAEIGKPAALAAIISNTAIVQKTAGDLPGAVARLQRALGMWRDMGERARLGSDLNNLGWTYLDLGEYGKAAECAREAVGIARETGHLLGECNAVWNLGRARSGLGEHGEAERLYEEALAGFRRLGDPGRAALVTATIARARAATGRIAEARDMMREAIERLDELGDARVGDLRIELAALRG